MKERNLTKREKQQLINIWKQIGTINHRLLGEEETSSEITILLRAVRNMLYSIAVDDKDMISFDYKRLFGYEFEKLNQ